MRIETNGSKSGWAVMTMVQKLWSEYRGTILLAMILWWLGMYPGIYVLGVFWGLMIPAVFLSSVWIPIVAIIAILIARKGRLPRIPRPTLSFGVRIAILALALWSVILEHPLDFGFRCSRSAFERELEHAPLYTKEVALREREHGGLMGVYLVSRVWRDERGGVYFCVSNDSMFDTTSFGFAHDPNPVGTPLERPT